MTSAKIALTFGFSTLIWRLCVFYQSRGEKNMRKVQFVQNAYGVLLVQINLTNRLHHCYTKPNEHFK